MQPKKLYVKQLQDSIKCAIKRTNIKKRAQNFSPIRMQCNGISRNFVERSKKYSIEKIFTDGNEVHANMSFMSSAVMQRVSARYMLYTVTCLSTQLIYTAAKRHVMLDGRSLRATRPLINPHT